MTCYKEVINNLILTKHGKENFYGSRKDKDDRTNIKLGRVAATICKGFKTYAGFSNQFESTYKGLKVIWKYDKKNHKWVVITYYEVEQPKSNIYKLFDQIKENY